ncbi:hypothetical protein GCM10027020_23120 [Nocardioides salsibiostraticola]
MTQDWSVPVWAVLAAAGVVLLVILALGLMVRSAHRRAEAQMRLTQQAAQALADQVAGLEARLDEGDASQSDVAHLDRADYVITRFGDPADPDHSDGMDDSSASHRREVEVRSLPRGVFADLLLRETAVRAAGMSAGLRRALAPETRNRIRFEMKQEVKRSRKQRKADLRIARREWEARQRAAGSFVADTGQEHA